MCKHIYICRYARAYVHCKMIYCIYACMHTCHHKLLGDLNGNSLANSHTYAYRMRNMHACMHARTHARTQASTNEPANALTTHAQTMCDDVRTHVDNKWESGVLAFARHISAAPSYMYARLPTSCMCKCASMPNGLPGCFVHPSHSTANRSWIGGASIVTMCVRTCMHIIP